MNQEKIFVLGAGGYVGSRLVPWLLSRGYSVRAAGRRLENLQKRFWSADPAVELREVNVFDRVELKQAAQGCQVGYYLVHSMNTRHPDFVEADRLAARNMIRAAESAGLTRLIYLGGLGDERTALSNHLQSRAEVGHILASGKIPVTTLRAAMIIGTASVSFEILRFLVHRLPVLITPKWIHTESQPIAIRNVLEYLGGCLSCPQTTGDTFDIGGQDIVSYRDLLDICTQEAGLKKRIMIPVPFFSSRLSSFCISILSPIPATIVRPLADGLTNRAVCQDQRILALIPQERISCRQAIRLALGKEVLSWGTGQGSLEKWGPEQQNPGDPDWVTGKGR